jgi:hypothetical protein
VILPLSFQVVIGLRPTHGNESQTFDTHVQAGGQPQATGFPLLRERQTIDARFRMNPKQKVDKPTAQHLVKAK